MPSSELDDHMAKSVAFAQKDHDSEAVKTRILSQSTFPGSSKDKVSRLDDIVNRYKIKVDPFMSSKSILEKTKDKLVIKDESIKKNTLEQLSYYSSDGSD